jgi:hypothetical protein
VAGGEGETMPLKCKCPDWAVEIKGLIQEAQIAFIHGISFKGKQFVFCPWCGAKLEEE